MKPKPLDFLAVVVSLPVIGAFSIAANVVDELLVSVSEAARAAPSARSDIASNAPRVGGGVWGGG